MNARKLLRTGAVLAVIFVGVVSGVVCSSASEFDLSDGGTVYLPVYSHIYVGIKGLAFDLAISLIIRNTDPTRPITVSSVSYHDSAGKLVKQFLEKPVDIPPLASKEFFVSESDTTGGFGAAFIVKWKSLTKVNAPVVEGVMVGTKAGQGISFTTRGQVIEDRGQ
ncbi:MAG: DUF3124 domain-containing protein [Desulfomonile tiedjei]|nr:DUF3124 domain-containing protein [Desulfomonile tiedjei]